MLEFKVANYFDDPDYDNCGSTTLAVLRLDNITIPLCEECVNDLIRDIEEYKNTIFCHQCDEFIMSSSGFHYGGSCKCQAREKDEEITEKDAGYKFCVNCLDTCTNAKPKKEKDIEQSEHLEQTENKKHIDLSLSIYNIPTEIGQSENIIDKYPVLKSIIDTKHEGMLFALENFLVHMKEHIKEGKCDE